MKIELIIKLFLISGVLVFLGILINVAYTDHVGLTVEAAGNIQGIQATSTESTITLTWDTPSPLPEGFIGYKIERYDIVYAPEAEMDIFVPDWVSVGYPAGNIVTIVDSNLKSDTEYRYRIQTRTNQGNSEWIYTTGKTTLGLTTDTVLSPTDFSITAITTSTLTLTWTIPSPTVNNFSFYEIQELAVEVEEWVTIHRITPQSKVSVDVDNLFSATTYLFRIRTVASQGNSEWISTSGITESDTDPPPLVFDEVLPPTYLSATTTTIVEGVTTTEYAVKLTWGIPKRKARTSQITGYNVYVYASEIEDFINITASLADENCTTSTCTATVRPEDIIIGHINLFAVENYDANRNTSRRISTSLFVPGTEILEEVLRPQNFNARDISDLNIPIYRVELTWDEPDSVYTRTSDIDNYNLYLLENDIEDSEGNTNIFISIDAYIYTTATATATDTAELSVTKDLKCLPGLATNCRVIVEGDILEPGVLYTFAIESVDKYGVPSKKIFTSIRVTGKKFNATVLPPPIINGYDIRDKNDLNKPTATSTYPWIRLEWNHPATSTSPNIAGIERYNIYLVENDISVDSIFYVPISVYGIATIDNSNLFMATSSVVTNHFITNGLTIKSQSSVYKNNNSNSNIGNVCNNEGCGIIVGGIGYRNASFYTFAIESVDKHGRKSIDKAMTSIRTHGKRYDAVVPPPLNVRAFSFTSDDNNIYKTRPIPDSTKDFQRIYLSWKQPVQSNFLGIADVANYNIYYLENAIEVDFDIYVPLDTYAISRLSGMLPTILSLDQDPDNQKITLLGEKCHDNIGYMDFASSTNKQLAPTSLKSRLKDNDCHVAIVEENFINGAIYTLFIASIDSNGRESDYIPVRIKAGGNNLKPNGLTVKPPKNLLGSDLSDGTNYQAILSWKKPIEQYNDATTEQYIVSLVEFVEEADEDIFEKLPTAFIMATTSTTSIPGVYVSNLYESGTRGFTIGSFSFTTSLHNMCDDDADNEDAEHACFIVIGNNKLQRGVFYTFAVQAVDNYGNLSVPKYINVRISNENIKPIDASLLPPLNFRLADISVRPEDTTIPSQYWIELSWIEPEDVWYYGTIVGYEIQYSEYFVEQEELSPWRIITDDIVKFSSTTSAIYYTDKSIGEISAGINPEEEGDIPIPQLLRAELCLNTPNCRGAFGNGVLDPSTRYFFQIRSVDSDGNYSIWIDRDIVLDGKKIFKPIHKNIKAPNTFRGYDDEEYLKVLTESFTRDDRTINFVLDESITDNWAILTWREPIPEQDTEDVERYEISQFSNVTEYDAIEYYRLEFEVSTSSTSTVNAIVTYSLMSTDEIMDVCTGFKPMRSNLNKLVNKKEYYDIWNSDSFRPTGDNIFTTTTPRSITSYFQNLYEFETPDGTGDYDVTIRLDTLVPLTQTLDYTIGISLVELGSDGIVISRKHEYSELREIIVNYEDALSLGTRYIVYVWTDHLSFIHRYKLSIIPTNPTVGDEFINEYAGEISTCEAAVGKGNLLSGETYRFGIQSVNENIKSEPPETTTVTIAGEKIPPPDDVVAAELYPEPSSIVKETIDNAYVLSGSHMAWSIRLQSDNGSPLRIYTADNLDDDCDPRVKDESIYSRTQVVKRPPESSRLDKKICLYLDETNLDTVRLRLYRDLDNKLLETYYISAKDFIGNGVFTFEPILHYYLEGESYLTTLIFLREGISEAIINTNNLNLSDENVRITISDPNADDPCSAVTFDNAMPILSLSTSTDLCILIKDNNINFENEIIINATTTVTAIATSTYPAISEYMIHITEPQKLFQNGVCDTNADGILTDNELDQNNNGIIDDDDYVNCGFGEDERYKTQCTDRLCLNVALESMCNTAGVNCNGELLRILVVLLVAFAMAAMPLAATATILSRFTIPAMVFSYLLFNTALWVGVWLANFPEYWALMPLLLTFIFGAYFTIRKFQNR